MRNGTLIIEVDLVHDDDIGISGCDTDSLLSSNIHDAAYMEVSVL